MYMSGKSWRNINDEPFDIHEYLSTVSELRKTEILSLNAATGSSEMASQVERNEVGTDNAPVIPLDPDADTTEMLADARDRVSEAIDKTLPRPRHSQ